MKLEEAEKLQDAFKSNLNEISRGGLNQKSKNVIAKYLITLQSTRSCY